MNDPTHHTDLSDPQRPPGRTPRRAEPLQPDRPPRGLDKEPAQDPALSDAGRRNRQEQERTAHENTREGYGG